MDNFTNTLLNLNDESKHILSIIQKKGPITKNQLILMTNMKLTTLNRFMQPLEESKLIVDAYIGDSTGGRKPILYDVNPSNHYVIGIDISRTYTQVILTNLKIDILGQRQFLMTEECSPDVTVNKVLKYIQELYEELSIDRQMVVGAGLGTVGPLDRKDGLMVHPDNFESKEWEITPIRAMLESKLNLPVIIDNGANMAVTAEHLFGEGRGFENIAYFNCGVGIRTGAIASGNLVRSINDVEDSFAHMVIDMDGELCSCGNYGCIECYASIHSIVKKYTSLYKRGKNSNVRKPIEQINYTDICQAAEENDELAREVITDSASVFGLGLANYINLLNPGLIILSGPLIKHSDLFYKVCTEVALKKIYLKDKKKIFFCNGGHFKDSAISAGGAAMIVESYLKDKRE